MHLRALRDGFESRPSVGGTAIPEGEREALAREGIPNAAKLAFEGRGSKGEGRNPFPLSCSGGCHFV